MKASTFMIMFGLFLTFGAVGGIELSTSDLALVEATLLAGLGLIIAYCGVLLQKTHTLDYYKKTIDNNSLW